MHGQPHIRFEITYLQMKVKFQGSECLTGKDVEDRSQYYLGIAWREWEKTRRICGKWGSQSLLKRIPGNWILMKNLTEQPLHEWGSEPGTKPVRNRSAELITWLQDCGIWSNTKICTCHTRPSDIRKATIFIKVKTINRRNTLKHKTENSKLWRKGNSSDGS